MRSTAVQNRWPPLKRYMNRAQFATRLPLAPPQDFCLAPENSGTQSVRPLAYVTDPIGDWHLVCNLKDVSRLGS
jgi:hypothetical protein